MTRRGAVVIRGEDQNEICVHHEGEITCPFCKKNFGNRFQLIEHLQRTSVNTQTFIPALPPAEQAGVFVGAQPNAQQHVNQQPQHQLGQAAEFIGDRQVPRAHNRANMLLNYPLEDLGARATIDLVNEHLRETNGSSICHFSLNKLHSKCMKIYVSVVIVFITVVGDTRCAAFFIFEHAYTCKAEIK